MTQATSNSNASTSNATERKIITRDEHAENRRLAMVEMGLPASKRQATAQVKRYGPKKVPGRDAYLKVEVRWDDTCGNGVNAFSVTADMYEPYRQPGEPYITMEGKRYWLNSCGCLHDEVKATFPELTEAIGYHLTMADGPMHYLANTLYHVRQHNLNYARSSACWPDAKLEEMTEKELLERLPALMERFRVVVEGLGLEY